MELTSEQKAELKRKAEAMQTVGDVWDALARSLLSHDLYPPMPADLPLFAQIDEMDHAAVAVAINAAFINPAAVLALLEENERLRRELEASRSQHRSTIDGLEREQRALDECRADLRDAALGWSMEADPSNPDMRRARVAAGLDPDPSTDYATGGALCMCAGRGWYEAEDGARYCVCPAGTARYDRDAADESR